MKKVLKKFIKNEKLRVEEKSTHLGFISFSNDNGTRELLKVGEIRNRTELVNWLDSIHSENDPNDSQNATFRERACELANRVSYNKNIAGSHMQAYIIL